MVRMWLPDRPGALGQVASRIGAVQGEIVGIDILERGAGRAIDELVVELPGGASLDLLVREVQQVDGVDVEEVRPVAATTHDPRLDALESVAALVAVTTRDDLVDAVVDHALRSVGGAWCAVVGLAGGTVVAATGVAPDTAWLAAFVEGSRSSAPMVAGDSGPDDMIWSLLPGADLALVVGRGGSAYRERERRQIAALAQIVDARLSEISRWGSRLVRPETS